MNPPPRYPFRALITGLGFVTSIGNSAGEVVESLRQLRGGIGPHGFAGYEDAAVKVVGTLKGFDLSAPNPMGWTYPEHLRIPRERLRSLPPHGVYTAHAIEEALAGAGLQRADLSDPGTGLYSASAGSAFMMHHQLNQLRESGGRRGHPLGVVSAISGTLNFNFGAWLGIRGHNLGFVSACASSAHALGAASDDIRLGRQRRAVVIGAEDLNAECVIPFAHMRALSTDDHERASRPFDVTRNGFVASGGAVVLILEEAALAAERHATPLAEVLGWGQASDGHDVAISHPEGDGLARAMERALADAGLVPADIDYVNAHATSTPVGDHSEALALRRVFSERGAHPKVSSTKGLTGHPLSMAGAMEAAFCALLLRHQFIPGNAHLQSPDPACDGLDLPRSSKDTPLRHILSNSSGFGGSNVSLVLGQAR